ncbi:hypothetical protein PYW08_011479 [Mythimna loreyi]|uniref:Uncharacterized protein n=1 Tax=Mythimna loreyi TaxID=667449 RepID=A0ACC2QPM1_9NEOP|nr:hypothetical protein PYW08_011479 [Mythimna loreyi]
MRCLIPGPTDPEAPNTRVFGREAENLNFKEFKESALRVMAAKNGSALTGNNPRMRRCVRASSTGAAAYDAYLRQRVLNNLAAMN